MDFIQKLKTISTNYNDYTHVSLVPYKSSFYIEHENIDTLLHEYSQYISSHPDTRIGIAEKIVGASPILCDIDIKLDISTVRSFFHSNTNVTEDEKYMESEPQILHSREDVEFVVSIYHQLFDKVFPTMDASRFSCVYLNKPPYFTEDGKYVKHGFHLHFPGIFLSKADHINHIIPHMKQHINTYFSQKYGVVSTTFYDHHIINAPWLMYMSRKASYQDTYEIDSVYTRDMHCVHKNALFSVFESYLIFDAHANQIPITPDTVGFLLPRILSIIPYGREVTTINIPVFESVNVREITTRTPVNEVRNDAEQESDITDYADNIAKCKVLLGMLSVSRAEDYHQWMIVGWTIFNACGPSLESLQLWLEFSQQSTKFNEQQCIDAWSKMKPRGMTIGTLFYYASKDSPVRFSEFRFNSTKESIYASITGSHYDIACIMYNDYQDFFICTDVVTKIWYVFEDHVWRETQAGIDLRRKISDEILQRFKRTLAVVSEQALEASEHEAELYENRKKEINKVILRLKTTMFKNSVMQECVEKFYSREFATKLDTNRELIAFNNGIYDLQALEFRPGIPEDALTKKMKIDYKQFDPFHPLVFEVHSFLEKVFPDASVRKYFLDACCRIFRGGNDEKKVYIWTGDGDNGKSITEKIFEKILGPYAIKLPTSLLTGKRTQSSSASPELARMGRGTRWAVLQEPDRRDEINVGILKELSGNDTFFARDLFQKGSESNEIQPMFRIALVCNEPPSITRGDKATWERIRVIPFESTFVNEDEVPETWDEQLAQKKFAKDPDFHTKIPHLLEPFAWVLIEHFKKTGKQPLVEPEKVRVATDLYKSKNDYYFQFMSENIEQVEDQSCKISLTEFGQAFKDWWTEELGNNSTNMMNREELKQRLNATFKGYEQGFIYSGCRFRNLMVGNNANEDIII